MDPHDPKPGRPAVVIEQIHGRADRAPVVTPTRDQVRGGIEQASQPELRLNDRAWYSGEYWIGAHRLIPGVVEFRGVLDEATFGAMIEECL